MKNLIASCVLILGVCNISFAGECLNGSCSVLVKPVRKVVSITREVIVSPLRVVADTTRNVVKYQPLRRKLVNSATVYKNNCSTCR